MVHTEPLISASCVSRCPDMEGIETQQGALYDFSSHAGVSRCPDMEGIETLVTS